MLGVGKPHSPHPSSNNVYKGWFEPMFQLPWSLLSTTTESLLILCIFALDSFLALASPYAVVWMFVSPKFTLKSNAPCDSVKRLQRLRFQDKDFRPFQPQPLPAPFFTVLKLSCFGKPVRKPYPGKKLTLYKSDAWAISLDTTDWGKTPSFWKIYD